jgi:hypothetical protein
VSECDCCVLSGRGLWVRLITGTEGCGVFECDCCVLSGRGLWVRLITGSRGLWCV